MDIVEEIKKICGDTIRLNNGWYYFVYMRQYFIFVPDKENKMIRISIPYVVKDIKSNSEVVKSSVNEINREVKYVKAMVLRNGSVSLNYDHKICNDNRPSGIVRHIIQTLYVASEYLTNKIELE